MLLYNLRGDICHGQRVESNVAVVKFPYIHQQMSW
jgi:hypothetical protein